MIEALRDNYFFYTHDESGVFTYLSPSITNVLGYSKEEFKIHFTAYFTQCDINKDVMGYHVVSRTSSIEALKLFKAQSDQFDLVITDMTMPQMTGDKLAIEVITIRKDIPVILCTGFSYQIAENKSLNTGIRGLLMKPIVRSEMAQMVRKVLDEANDPT